MLRAVSIVPNNTKESCIPRLFIRGPPTDKGMPGEDQYDEREVLRIETWREMSNADPLKLIIRYQRYFCAPLHHKCTGNIQGFPTASSNSMDQIPSIVYSLLLNVPAQEEQQIKCPGPFQNPAIQSWHFTMRTVLQS